MVGNRLIATQIRASGNGASATARSYGTTSYRKLTISRGTHMIAAQNRARNMFLRR